MSTQPTLPSDPQSMPLNDLKNAAGLGDPQPTATPVQAPEPVAAPAPIVPESFTVTQDDSGIVVQMAPEFGGETFKGKDWADVGPKIAKAKADANSYIKQLKATPPAPPAAEPVVPAAPTETPEEIATRNWIMEQTAKAHGMSLDQYKAFVAQTFQTVEKMSVNTAFAEFSQACPDYSDTPENAAVLAGYFPANIDHFPTAQELRTAWALARYEGKGQASQPAQPQPTIKQPPPMPGVSSSPAPSNQNEWQMPLDQLKAQAGLVR